MPRPARALLLVLLLSAPALAGCVELKAARVPSRLLEGKGGNGWEQNITASEREPQESALGLSAQQTLAYEDLAREGAGFPGSLRITTLRGILTPSEDALAESVRDQVASSVEAAGVRIDGKGYSGTREVSSGATSQYFVYNGSVTRADSVFARNTRVKIVGEVFQCREERTSVVSVGLAQVTRETSTRPVGGLPVSSSPDATTWQELVADPSGSIEGIKGGRGLLYNVVCA